MLKEKKLIILATALAILVALLAIFGIRALTKDKISYSVKDTLPDGGGKKATIILLGGQSNASGCSRDEYLKKNVSAEKYQEYEDGYDNVYINYFSSGNNRSDEFVKASVMQGENGGYFGPELGMADKLHEMYPDETFFIIKWAWGGTNLFEQWLSPSSDGKTGDLYKHFVTYVNASVKYLVSKNYDVTIEGMCWMQGESDSFSTENATDYEIHLTNFIKDIRKEFKKYAADDGIAFIDAYIADNPVYWVYCDMVNESKRRVAESSDMNVVVDTITEGLSCSAEPEDTPDVAHYDSMSEIKLGHLFIEHLAPFM